MGDIRDAKPMTVRQLIDALEAVPRDDIPVFGWTPGSYWEPLALHWQSTASGGAYAMLELNYHGDRPTPKPLWEKRGG